MVIRKVRERTKEFWDITRWKQTKRWSWISVNSKMVASFRLNFWNSKDCGWKKLFTNLKKERKLKNKATLWVINRPLNPVPSRRPPSLVPNPLEPKEVFGSFEVSHIINNKQRNSALLTYRNCKENRFENIPDGSSLVLLFIKSPQEN